MAKDDHRGVVESAFLMLVEPASQAATIGVDTDAVGTNGDDGSVCNRLTHWDQFCDDFADVFEPPGFHTKRLVLLKRSRDQSSTDP